jgi:hypothetical protein
MLEAELFAFLERTSDAAFAVTEQGARFVSGTNQPKGSSGARHRKR